MVALGTSVQPRSRTTAVDFPHEDAVPRLQSSGQGFQAKVGMCHMQQHPPGQTHDETDLRCQQSAEACLAVEMTGIEAPIRHQDQPAARFFRQGVVDQTQDPLLDRAGTLSHEL